MHNLKLISWLAAISQLVVGRNTTITHTVTITKTIQLCKPTSTSTHISSATSKPIIQKYSFVGPSASSLEFDTVLSGYSSVSQTAFKHGIVFMQTAPTDPIGYLLSSDNSQSGNIFMGLVKNIHAAPNTTYALNFTVSFLTNVATGCAGIGASPGDNGKCGSGTCDTTWY